MTALANKNEAINLSQGFPDFPADRKLSELLFEASISGMNQYAPMTGVRELKENISKIIFLSYGRVVDYENEITITSGATEAIFAAVTAVVSSGDEVIIFDPCYDSYEPAILINHGVPVHIPLTFPEYRINWEKVKSALCPKTKLIIINSPNNPAGAVISGDDILNLKELAKKFDFYILSDEVYEHIIFDGEKHLSMVGYDELYERSFIVSSFGKTFHVTGWKVGYCTAPKELTNELRKIHQFLTFSTSTPAQNALAKYTSDIKRIADLKKFYEQKRDFFLNLIKQTGFKPLDCKGTYFQLLDYSDITDENDYDFAVRLTKESKVASIPVSVFYKEKTDNKVLRFCFAKENKTLESAVEKLQKLK